MTPCSHRELLRLSHRTAERLRSSGMVARTVALKLRYADFSTITRSRTVHTPVDSTQLIYAVVLQLLESLGDRSMTVRLVGVRAEQLEETAQTSLQLSLDRRDDNWRAAEQALDKVSRKFGNKSVLPARLLDSGKGLSLVPAPCGVFSVVEPLDESHCRLSERPSTNYPYIYIVFESTGHTASRSAMSAVRELVRDAGRYRSRSTGWAQPGRWPT